MERRDRDTSDGGERRVRELIEAAGPRPEVPEEDLGAIVAAARAEWHSRWESRGEAARRRRWGLAAAAGIAAVLVLAVGLAAWWRARPAAPGGPAPEAVALIEAAAGPVELAAGEAAPVPAGEGERVAAGSWVHTGGEEAGALGRASLRLASGATLRLDAGTRLRLTSASVLELERGAVYVDTAGATSPTGALEVRTALGTARDVGTRFAVRLLGGEGGALRVQVRDGAVEVERRGRTYRAGVGDELVVRGAEPVERREVSPHGSDWEWVIAAAPPFELEGRSLRELLDWVSRETGWRILYEDEALEAGADEIVLHGSAEGLRADQAAFAVLPGAGLEGELGGGVLLVRRPSGSS
jgi:hypothetical protein